MLSVVTATHDSERALLRTLAALVPGAVAGVVREVIVCDGGSTDATTQIAESAGCRVVTPAGPRGARLRAAADAARARWILFIEPGVVPNSSWIDEVRRFIEESELRELVGSCAAVVPPVWSSLRSGWGGTVGLLRTAFRIRNARQALLIGRELYDAIGGHRDVSDPERELLSRLGRRRIVLLGTGTG